MLFGCSGLNTSEFLQHYSGKFAARVDSSTQSGTYRLASSHDALALTVLGPMGITLAQIESTPTLTKVRITGQDPIETNDPSGLIQRTFGLYIHPMALPYWLDGQPMPNIASQVLSDAEFIQGGIFVRVTRRGIDGKPALIKLTDQNKQAQLTLTVIREPLP